jgi:hypothetical protein
MGMHLGLRLVAVTIIVTSTALIAGCGAVDKAVDTAVTPSTPKCSDESTLDLVRQIVGKMVKGDDDNDHPYPDAILKKHLLFELPVATKLEENIHKYSCEARLVLVGINGAQQKIGIEYTSQLDDQNDQLGAVSGMSQLDALTIAEVLNTAVAAAAATNQPAEPALPDSTVAEGTPEAVAEPEAEGAPSEDAADASQLDAATPSEAPSLGGPNSGNPTPKFGDYPVGPIYSGPAARLATNNELAKSFRTRFRDALTQAPNFAGEYVATGWGCGTSCGITAFVNKRTGQVVNFTFGGEEGPSAYRFSVNSKLLVAVDSGWLMGMDDGAIKDDKGNWLYQAHYFAFDGTSFREVATVPITTPLDPNEMQGAYPDH